MPVKKIIRKNRPVAKKIVRKVVGKIVRKVVPKAPLYIVRKPVRKPRKVSVPVGKRTVCIEGYKISSGGKCIKDRKYKVVLKSIPRAPMGPLREGNTVNFGVKGPVRQRTFGPKMQYGKVLSYVSPPKNFKDAIAQGRARLQAGQRNVVRGIPQAPQYYVPQAPLRNSSKVNFGIMGATRYGPSPKTGRVLSLAPSPKNFRDAITQGRALLKKASSGKKITLAEAKTILKAASMQAQ